MTDRITPDATSPVTPEPAAPAGPATSPDRPASDADPKTSTPADDPVQSAIAATRADALAIAELCQLAGYPQRIVTFLAQGASAAEVRRALLATRAESPEIDSRLAPDAPAREAHPDHSPLIQAVKKLTGKD